MKNYKRLCIAISLGIGGGLYAAEFINPLAHAKGVSQRVKNVQAFRGLSEEEKVAIKMEMQEALAELALKENRSETILEEAQAMCKQDSQEEFDEALDTVKWQNTLLGTVKIPLPFKLHIPLGLYKSDLAEFSLTGADAVGDILLYKSLTRKRIEAVFESIKADYTGLLRALTQSLDAEAQYELTQEDGVSNDYFITTVACAPLRKYLAEKHRLMGTFPLNKNVLAPLVLRWGWERISTVLRESFFPEINLNNAHDSKPTRAERTMTLK
ncbi:hypothetical protein H0W26_04270, partial [Candidatus Dependentiae bacterium]|nr:hypothetical protein [Candidatus Dependentiae bacterium]